MYTTPSTVCLCDNIGLVSLILLGWELHVSYITVLCVQGIPILSPSLYMPSLYSTLEFLIYPSQTLHTQQLLPLEVYTSLFFLSATIYRACVVDFLGVGIMCVYYIIVLAMCSSHHDLVSFAFSAIPIFHILDF